MAYPNFNEGRYIADVVKYDIQLYSRDMATIAQGSGVLDIGTVLGVNGEGKMVPVNPAATTGEQIASNVLLKKVDTATADVDALVLSRHAVVADNSLIWPEGISDTDKQTAIGQLIAIGIVPREEV